MSIRIITLKSDISKFPQVTSANHTAKAAKGEAQAKGPKGPVKKVKK